MVILLFCFGNRVLPSPSPAYSILAPCPLHYQHTILFNKLNVYITQDINCFIQCNVKSTLPNKTKCLLSSSSTKWLQCVLHIIHTTATTRCVEGGKEMEGRKFSVLKWSGFFANDFRHYMKIDAYVMAVLVGVCQCLCLSVYAPISQYRSVSVYNIAEGGCSNVFGTKLCSHRKRNCFPSKFFICLENKFVDFLSKKHWKNRKKYIKIYSAIKKFVHLEKKGIFSKL